MRTCGSTATGTCSVICHATLQHMQGFTSDVSVFK